MNLTCNGKVYAERDTDPANGYPYRSIWWIVRDGNRTGETYSNFDTLADVVWEGSE
jgi:hypothetical protein